MKHYICSFSVAAMLAIEKQGGYIVKAGSLFIEYQHTSPIAGFISWQDK